MKVDLTKDQAEQLIKQQAKHIALLEVRIARATGYINSKINNRGKFRTKIEELSDIKELLYIKEFPTELNKIYEEEFWNITL